jgi:ferric-dicitrate binding protein FerR (iron transport regulator)
MSDESDEVEGLVRMAGARPAPPPARAAGARARVHAAWRAGVRRRRIATVLLSTAAAAAIATLVVTARQDERQGAPVPGPQPAVAWLDVGSVEREVAGGWAGLAADDGVPAGSRLRIGTRGAGLRMQSGRSIRLGAGTRLRFAAVDRLALEAGVVYVDSGGMAGARSSFEVATEWGDVRETGTQFEVALEPSALRVRVREGWVALLGRGPTLDVAGGSELRVDERGSSRRSVATHGPEWSWVLALAPAFELEGRSLSQLLEWAAREGGWELRYSDAETRKRAEAALLHGSIRGLRADDALAAVVPATGLSHALHSGMLVIGPAAPER